MTELPPDVRDRAATALFKNHEAMYGGDLDWGVLSESQRDVWRDHVDAVAAVVLGEDVIVLSRVDAAWLCDVLHGEGQTEREYNRAHQLLEGGA